MLRHAKWEIPFSDGWVVCEQSQDKGLVFGSQLEIIKSKTSKK